MINPKLVKKIKEFEGFREKAYHLPGENNANGQPIYTIGYGFHSPSIKVTDKISEPEAEKKLIVTIEAFKKAIEPSIKNLKPHQQDAMICFAYNVGVGYFRKCHVSTLLKTNKLDLIPSCLLLYVRGSNKVILPGLVKRRKWEADLFARGYPA